jgi:hypothetical protein
LGGRGGDGGSILISAKTITTGTVHAHAEGGAGGLGGAAGTGGTAGQPGGEVHALNPNGNPPIPGPNGHTGMGGARGIDGSIDIVEQA